MVEGIGITGEVLTQQKLLRVRLARGDEPDGGNGQGYDTAGSKR